VSGQSINAYLSPAAIKDGKDVRQLQGYWKAPGDAQMTCRQMADQAAALSDLMSDQSQTGPLGRMTGVARAGAGMLIPGVGLLGAAVDALTAGQREKREAQRMAVRDRWHYLNGLYAGRRCA